MEKKAKRARPIDRLFFAILFLYSEYKAFRLALLKEIKANRLYYGVFCTQKIIKRLIL